MKRLIFAMFLASASAFGAGNVTQSMNQLGTSGNVVIGMAWTGDAISGAVPSTNAFLQGCCQGYTISQVEIVPLSPSPTNGYNITITDPAGVDALGGQGAGLSSTTATSFGTSTAYPPLQGTFTLNVSGQSAAGAKGIVYIFLTPPQSAFRRITNAILGLFTHVGTYPPGTIGSRLQETISVRDAPFYAAGNGVKDDTAAIQAAVTWACSGHGSMVYFPQISASTVYSLALGGIQIVNCSNVRITGDSGVTIRVAAGAVDTVYNSWPNYGLNSILRIVDSKHITVDGITLDGNLPNRTAHVGGESFNSCILAAGSTDLHFKNINTTGCMTDGVTYVADGSQVGNTDVWLEDSFLTTARRNNVTYDGCINCFAHHNVVTLAGTIQGTSPEANIGSEPDFGSSGQANQNIVLDSNYISGANGSFNSYFSGFGTNGCTVSNNTITGGNVGIDFETASSSYQNTNCVLTGGTISNNSVAGIRDVDNSVLGPNLSIISGVDIDGNGTGILLFESNGVQIVGNTIENSVNIAIGGNDPTPGNCTTNPICLYSLAITGNTFRNNFSATGLSNGFSGSIMTAVMKSSASILTFSGNTVADTASTYKQAGMQVTLVSAFCNCQGRGNNWTNLNASINGGNLSNIPGIESASILTLDYAPTNTVSPIPSATIISSDGTLTGSSILNPYNYISGTTTVTDMVPPASLLNNSGGVFGKCITIITTGNVPFVTGGTSGTRIYNSVTSVGAASGGPPIFACYDQSSGGWHLK